MRDDCKVSEDFSTAARIEIRLPSTFTHLFYHLGNLDSPFLRAQPKNGFMNAAILRRPAIETARAASNSQVAAPKKIHPDHGAALSRTGRYEA
jgi:hypothetical protein